MPSAPTFAAAIPGIEVGPPHAGTCAAAVYSGMPVSSADVATDERFDPLWRRLNAEHGVRRIKSRPVKSADGRALGSFFIAFTSETPAPWPEEIETLCARLGGLCPRAPSRGGTQSPDLRRDAAPPEEPVCVGAVDRRADLAKRADLGGIHEGLRGPRAGAGRRARSAVAGRVGGSGGADASHRRSVCRHRRHRDRRQALQGGAFLGRAVQPGAARARDQRGEIRRAVERPGQGAHIVEVLSRGQRRAALQVQVGRERRPQRGAAAAQRLRHHPDEARLRRRRGPVAADARAGRPALQGRRAGERPARPPAGGRCTALRTPQPTSEAPDCVFVAQRRRKSYIGRTLCASSAFRGR